MCTIGHRVTTARVLTDEALSLLCCMAPTTETQQGLLRTIKERLRTVAEQLGKAELTKCREEIVK